MCTEKGRGFADPRADYHTEPATSCLGTMFETSGALFPVSNVSDQSHFLEIEVDNVRMSAKKKT